MKPPDTTSPICGILTPDAVASDGTLVPEARQNLTACGFVEIRFDLFGDPARWTSLISLLQSAAPHAQRIGTIRLEKDGGRFPTRNSAARLALLDTLLHGLHWVDWEAEHLDEADAWLMGQELTNASLLVSHHAFDAFPGTAEMQKVMGEAMAAGAGGLKLALACQQESQCNDILAFCRQQAGRFDLLSCFGMGAIGQQTRWRSIQHGANLTYAPLAGKVVAPGQLDLPSLAACLRNTP